MAYSPFLEMNEICSTRLWNDSADLGELKTAISWGAVGATCNPVIALTTLKQHQSMWIERIREFASVNVSASEDTIGWAMVRQMSREAARLLEPVFDEYQGKNGRLSIQTDPRLYRNTQELVDQAIDFASIAKNIIVKIPVTEAGLAAFEEASYRGVSVNATVSFTVSQAIAVGEAVERGLKRREAEGMCTSDMGPVCTIMVGRTDDWMRISAQRAGVEIQPEAFDWAGIAVFKEAYQHYKQRGFRTRLLAAAFRNTMHWSELVGGDVVISPPFVWQQKINESGIRPTHRIDSPVDPSYMDQLFRLTEFKKAFDINGLAPHEFNTYGATARTLRQFLKATNELEMFVRDVTVKDPDL